jgi:hypothetical protein
MKLQLNEIPTNSLGDTFTLINFEVEVGALADHYLDNHENPEFQEFYSTPVLDILALDNLKIMAFIRENTGLNIQIKLVQSLRKTIVSQMFGSYEEYLQERQKQLMKPEQKQIFIDNLEKSEIKAQQEFLMLWEEEKNNNPERTYTKIATTQQDTIAGVPKNSVWEGILVKGFHTINIHSAIVLGKATILADFHINGTIFLPPNTPEPTISRAGNGNKPEIIQCSWVQILGLYKSWKQAA